MLQRVRDELDDHVVLWGVNASLAAFAAGLLVLGDAMASLAVGMFVAVVYTYLWRGEGPGQRWCAPFLRSSRGAGRRAAGTSHPGGPGRDAAEDLDAA